MELCSGVFKRSENNGEEQDVYREYIGVWNFYEQGATWWEYSPNRMNSQSQIIHFRLT